MTPSEQSLIEKAHEGALRDVEFDPYYSYDHYLQLHLRMLRRIEEDKTAELVAGFYIVEPKRLWA